MDEDQEPPPRADAFAVSSDASVTLFEVDRRGRADAAAARKAERAAARKQQNPFPRPRGRSPPGCTWDEQQGGWWKADGSEWQRSKVPEPKVPEGPTKWTSAFEAELAARRAREEAVRFDGCTVYCAKHLYSINDEMCSTCAKKG